MIGFLSIFGLECHHASVLTEVLALNTSIDTIKYVDIYTTLEHLSHLCREYGMLISLQINQLYALDVE